MIKKFDNFVNERYYDSKKFATLEPNEIVDVIEDIKPGKPVLFRCHWAVAQYAIPTLCKKLSKYSKYEYVKVDCSALTVDDVKSVLSEPGKFYLLNEIHRTDQDTLKYLFNQLLNYDDDKSSIFVATTTTYKNDDEDFFDEMGRLLDRFYGIYQID